MSYQQLYAIQQNIKGLTEQIADLIERVQILEKKTEDYDLSAPDSNGAQMVLKRKPGRPRKDSVATVSS